MRSDSLDGWIAARHVCWELAPASEVRGGTRVHAGFQLTLLARDPRGLAGSATDPTRVRAWVRLRELAQRALGPESGWSMRHDPFDRAWHLRPGGNWEPELQFSAVLEPLQGHQGGHAERDLVLAVRRGFQGLGVPEAR